MSCSSAICTVNSTQMAYPAESQIPFGTTIRRFGKYIQQDGNSILLTQRGYYNVIVTLNAEATEAGTVQANLLLNGTPLQGAFAVETAAAAGDTVSLTIPYLVRLCTCDTTDILSVQLNDAATLVNMSTVVTKV